MIARLHRFPIALLKGLIKFDDDILIVIHGISVGGSFSP
jgi:hypothetical protein